jgi:LuxR family maltose regulon positive regulatory protein
VAAFSGSHRYVLDYLTGRYEHLDDRTRDFVLETSVLERMSAELCDAVTGRTGSQALLEQVEQAGLFLVPLDEIRGWWRYHHLFADLLRARLQQERPARVMVLHRAAAAWHAERDLADDAVRHAPGRRDTVWAARLIEQHFDATYHRGQRARSTGGWRRCPSAWSTPARGWNWRRRGWRWSAATWKRPT